MNSINLESGEGISATESSRKRAMWIWYVLGALLITGAIVVAVWSGIIPLDTRYRSIARFEVKRSTLDSPGQSTADDEGFRKLLKHEAIGGPALERLIQGLNLTRGFARSAEGELTNKGRQSYDELLSQLARSITISFEAVDGNTYIVAVEVRETDWQLAPLMANLIVENFIRSRREREETPILNERTMVGREVEQNQRKLKDLEAAMSPLLPAPGPTPPERLAAIITKLEERQRESALASAQLQRFRQDFKETPPSDTLMIEMVRLQSVIDVNESEIKNMTIQRDALVEAAKVFTASQTKLRQMEIDMESTRSLLQTNQSKFADLIRRLALWESSEGRTRLQFIERARDIPYHLRKPEDQAPVRH